jgi:IS30 family transposase
MMVSELYLPDALRQLMLRNHPFAAWERGTNENMNGLVRQYIPKQREFASVTDHELLCITNRLNHRPRKCLDFLTHFEVFFEHSVARTS